MMLKFKVPVVPKGDYGIVIPGDPEPLYMTVDGKPDNRTLKTVNQSFPVALLALVLVIIFAVALIIKLRIVYLQHALAMTDTQDS